MDFVENSLKTSWGALRNVEKKIFPWEFHGGRRKKVFLVTALFSLILLLFIFLWNLIWALNLFLGFTKKLNKF